MEQKHVFFIHSQITKLVSLSIVNYLALDKDSIIFLLYRGMTIDAYYSTSVFPFRHYPEDSFSISKKFWNGRKKLEKLDEYIYKVTSNKYFHLYLPQTNESMLRLMMSHPKCKSFSLIEEGKLSFTSFQDRTSYIYPLKDFTLIKLNYGQRLGRVKSYLDSNYNTAFKFSDAAFPDFQRVNKIDLRIANLPTKENEEVKQILVLEPIVEAKIVEIGEYLLALLKLIKTLEKNRIRTVYYKFHPDQQVEVSKKYLLALFKEFSFLEFIELSSNISLEEIAVNSNSKFYAVVSSMLYYAQYLGSTAYSFANLFPFDENLKIYLEHQPRAFLENLNYFDEETSEQHLKTTGISG
jgi:hypothetical protein